MPKIDIVITRHAPLVALLRERGTIDDTTPVIEHASISDVAGKHVLGVLPHWLSSKAASVTEVPMIGLTQVGSSWRLEGRDGFKLAPWVADLRFVDEEQA